MPSWMERTIPSLSIGKAKPKGVVVADWDRNEVRFLALSPQRTGLEILASASAPRTPDDTPMSTLGKLLAGGRFLSYPLVLLLSRTDLEMISLVLPQEARDQFPEMVQLEIEQRLGEHESAPVVDYAIAGNNDASGVDVLAFSLLPEEVDRWNREAKEEKLRLAAIAPRHLSLLAKLPAGAMNQTRVAIQSLPSEVEMVVARGSQPLFLRTLRLSTDDASSIAEQILLEVQRCLSLLPSEHQGEEAEVATAAPSPAPPLFVFPGTDAGPLAEALRERKVAEVHYLTSSSLWPSGSVASEIRTEQFASLLGAGEQFLQHQLPVNLLAPKRPPKPIHPLRKWGPIGGLTAASLVLGGWFLYSDVRDLNEEANRLQTTRDDQWKLANKSAERIDKLDLVETWEAERVDWLSLMASLSSTLPLGDRASVRRMTASVSNAGPQVSLSVMVKSPEDLALMEEKLRSQSMEVSSQRVNQQASEEDYPWQFETTIVAPWGDPPHGDRWVEPTGEVSEPSASDQGSEATHQQEDLQSPSQPSTNAVEPTGDNS
ncbi:MAG: hypothetical protein ACK56G_06470 [Pirellulaceae bacterium]